MKTLTRRHSLQWAAGLTAAAVAGPRMTAQDGSDRLDADYDVLRQALEIHPGALRYMNPAALGAAFDHFTTEYAASPLLEQRYLALSRFLAKLKCGHTYANVFNQSQAVQNELFDRPNRLPFAFRWLGSDMVVTQAHESVALPRGSILTRINGVTPQDILSALSPYTRADGAAPGKRKALLEVQHRSRIEYFDVFYGLVFGAPAGGEHRLEAVTPAGQAVTLTAPALDLAGRRAMRDAAIGARGRSDPLWRFEVRDGVGVLTMPSWATFNTDWGWRAWLDARLDELADLRGLVIDNRANEGGDPLVGMLILSRLIKEPVTLPTTRRLVRFRTFPQSLRNHVRTWDPSFYSIGEDATAIGRGFYALPADKQVNRIEPRGVALDLPAVLLTSPTNSSAGFEFARIAQATGRMTLVGEPTGGNRRGINGDGFFFTTLPVSGIEFDLPMVGRFPTEPQPDQGVIPDIEIRDRAADIAMGADPALQRALALAAGA